MCNLKVTKHGPSHLYSAVTPVSYNDVPVGVHGHASGGVELAVAFTMRAKFEQELSIRTVHLRQGVGKNGFVRINVNLDGFTGNSSLKSETQHDLPLRSDCENPSR